MSDNASTYSNARDIWISSTPKSATDIKLAGLYEADVAVSDMLEAVYESCEVTT